MRPLNAQIRLDNLRQNYRFLKELHGNKLLAVIKADAYGHGAVRCAHALADIADGFAVATVDEAWSCVKTALKIRLFCWKAYLMLPSMRMLTVMICGRQSAANGSWRRLCIMSGNVRQLYG